MYRLVVFQILYLILETLGMSVLRDPFFNPMEINCVKYSSENLVRMMNEGWRSETSRMARVRNKRSFPDLPAQFVLNPQEMARRMSSIDVIDNLIPRGDYLVKEHAKLVHDINSLRQVVFITPLIDENKDYDDSIFHEMIETVTTSTTLPQSSNLFSRTSPSLMSTKGTSIPVILAGVSTQRQVVKSQPINFAKPTVSLIGSKISPVIKHPYPFIMPRKPIKICVTSLPPISTPPPRPKTVWERIVDYFVPRHNLALFIFGSFFPVFFDELDEEVDKLDEEDDEPKVEL